MYVQYKRISLLVSEMNPRSCILTYRLAPGNVAKLIFNVDVKIIVGVLLPQVLIKTRGEVENKTPVSLLT